MCVEKKKREVLIYALYAHDGSQVGYRPVGGVVLRRRETRYACNIQTLLIMNASRLDSFCK